MSSTTHFFPEVMVTAAPETLAPEFGDGIPTTADDWRALAERLWRNGDEAHAAYAHSRALAIELGI